MTMIRRLAVSVACALAASFAAAAFAQPQVPPGVRPPPPGPRAPAPAPSSAPATLDRVVAVVNNEALTLFEMNEQKRILVQQLRVVAIGEPAGIPGPVDAKPQADRIYFLAHIRRSPRAHARPQ